MPVCEEQKPNKEELEVKKLQLEIAKLQEQPSTEDWYTQKKDRWDFWLRLITVILLPGSIIGIFFQQCNESRRREKEHQREEAFLRSDLYQKLHSDLYSFYEQVSGSDERYLDPIVKLRNNIKYDYEPKLLFLGKTPITDSLTVLSKQADFICRYQQVVLRFDSLYKMLIFTYQEFIDEKSPHRIKNAKEFPHEMFLRKDDSANRFANLIGDAMLNFNYFFANKENRTGDKIVDSLFRKLQKEVLGQNGDLERMNNQMRVSFDPPPERTMELVEDRRYDIPKMRSNYFRHWGNLSFDYLAVELQFKARLDRFDSLLISTNKLRE